MPCFRGSLKAAIALAFVGTAMSGMRAGNEGVGWLPIGTGSSMQKGLACGGRVVAGIMATAMYELIWAVERFTTTSAHRGSQRHRSQAKGVSDTVRFGEIA